MHIKHILGYPTWVNTAVWAQAQMADYLPARGWFVGGKYPRIVEPYSFRLVQPRVVYVRS
jgi:hypothetical protein